jgi:hypothetical protein
MKPPKKGLLAARPHGVFTFAPGRAIQARGWGVMSDVRVWQNMLSRVRSLAAPFVLSIAILGGLFLLANQTVNAPFLYKLQTQSR